MPHERAAAKEAVKMINVVGDSASSATDEQVAEFLKDHSTLKVSMAVRPWHHRDGITDRPIEVKNLRLTDKYLRNDDSGDVFLGSGEPGGWVAYAIDERSRIVVYGLEFRVVDIWLYLRPTHDGHARFGTVVYEAFCRLVK